MAYLDSAGNVDPSQQATVEQWQRFHRQQAALFHLGGNSKIAAPANSLIVGAEKASKGTN